MFVRGQIVGLIVSTPTGAEGRLKAAFSADLFEVRGFEAVIGYDREAGRIAVLRTAATVCLQESESAREYLGSALRAAQTGAEALAARVIGLPTPEAVIRTLKEAHEKALAGKQPRAAAAFRELALIALPACFDGRIVEAIRNNPGDPHQAVLSPPLFTGTAAELAMAAVDGQPARFKPTETAEESGGPPYPEGAYSLDHPPRLGFRAEVEDGYFKESLGSAFDQQVRHRPRFRACLRLGTLPEGRAPAASLGGSTP